MNVPTKMYTNLVGVDGERGAGGKKGSGVEGGGGGGDEGMTEELVGRETKQLVGVETFVEEIPESVRQVLGDVARGDVEFSTTQTEN